MGLALLGLGWRPGERLRSPQGVGRDGGLGGGWRQSLAVAGGLAGAGDRRGAKPDKGPEAGSPPPRHPEPRSLHYWAAIPKPIKGR